MQALLYVHLSVAGQTDYSPYPTAYNPLEMPRHLDPRRSERLKRPPPPPGPSSTEKDMDVTSPKRPMSPTSTAAGPSNRQQSGEILIYHRLSAQVCMGW